MFMLTLVNVKIRYPACFAIWTPIVLICRLPQFIDATLRRGQRARPVSSLVVCRRVRAALLPPPTSESGIITYRSAALRETLTRSCHHCFAVRSTKDQPTWNSNGARMIYVGGDAANDLFQGALP